jgi:hypothetical protein
MSRAFLRPEAILLAGICTALMHVENSRERDIRQEMERRRSAALGVPRRRLL